MKKLSVGFVAVFMFLAVFAVNCFAQEGQLQKEGDAYCLYSSDDFVILSKMVEEGFDFTGSEIKLMNDVLVDSSKFSSIGTDKYQFNGTFDGQNRIVDFTYKEVQAPLFGHIGKSGVVNGVIVGSLSNSKDGYRYEGLAYTNEGMIDNCDINVDVEAWWDVGGVVRNNSGRIANCTVNSCVCCLDENHTASGIASSNSGTIENCTFAGILSGSDCKRSEFVCNNSGIISNCNFTGRSEETWILDFWGLYDLVPDAPDPWPWDDWTPVEVPLPDILRLLGE